MGRLNQYVSAVILAATLVGCASSPPQDPENICEIFREHDHWYDAAIETQTRWGVPVHVAMSIIYQESSFEHDARPPMEYFLFIPTGRASSAYGYAQALDGTWDEYVKEADRSFASRDDFDDAYDFIGWYVHKTHQLNGVSKWDAYRQYLNYHEGWGGYRRGSHNRKQWLLNVAKRVEQRAMRYAGQYRSCKAELDNQNSWF